MTTIRSDYAAFTDTPEAQLDDALVRGQRSIDITYTLPAGAAQAAVALQELLDEADGFCRDGDLLTLETPPDLAAFRRWFLGQFPAQVSGDAPTPWVAV